MPPKLAATSAALKALPSDRLRYQQLLAMAGKLPAMPAELKVPENKVPGCLSTVHVHAECGDDGKLVFLGDSDALISKGLVAILVNGLTGCTAEEVAAVKPEFIKESGITQSLTPGRNNGFFNMLKLMNKKATELSQALESKVELQINNSMTRRKEVFTPLQAGVVNMYVCGVTVYDLCHLGHARVMVFFDVVARYLRHLGYEVRYVRNVTDVDDKIIKRSREAGESVEALSRRMEKEMQDDAASLGCEAPTFEPRVSEHMSSILGMVQGLEEKGYAYSGRQPAEAEAGAAEAGAPPPAEGSDVYFRVRKFSTYGRLSRCSLDGNQAGARVEVGSAKEAPEDFVLWKAAKAGEPRWDSPWGPGRPGWHIECSAMARKLLGDTLDIHGGGPDLMFPHHENEIAQSEAHNGKPYVKTWMHCAAVRSADKEKMSKSLGNFVTIRDVLRTHDGEVLRFYLLSSQYRQPLQYSEDGLAAAQERLLRLYSALRGLPLETPVAEDRPRSEAWSRFEAALSNDFDTVSAIAVLSDVSRELLQLQQQQAGAAGDAAADAAAVALAGELRAMGALLGILQQDPEALLRGRGAAADGDSAAFEARVEALIADRRAAREARDFARADAIRDEIASLGVVIEDGAAATTWRVQAVAR